MSDFEGPEQWGTKRCSTCGYFPPCQCPGNPFGTGTGLDPETFPEPGTYVGPALEGYATAEPGQWWCGVCKTGHDSGQACPDSAVTLTPMIGPHLKGAQDGYAVEEWLTLVNSGQRSGDQPGPTYDADLMTHPDYSAAYRQGLAEGRARYIDECLQRMADIRDTSGWRGVGLDSSGVPDPRDNGPYETEEQALTAMEAANFGIPVASLDHLRELTVLQMRGALLMTGVVTTRYEESELRAMTEPEGVGTSGCQVITGWIMRAWLAGHVAGALVGENRATAQTWRNQT